MIRGKLGWFMRAPTLIATILVLTSCEPNAATHWAYQTIDLSDRDGSIDTFINEGLREQNLKAQPPTSEDYLLRRVHLNLTGLAPTLQERQEFLSNDSPKAYEQVVDKLLDSPHHGERWGRHWMDVWRYSDWYGLGKQLRVSQKHMWRWRDWIVNSLNADKGYDRMIQEMLAGDELDPANQDVVAGTGFLARNYYLFNRTTWLDNTIEHTAKAFLGMTMNCVKCHDHKYDPIKHEDYYRFRAIFEPHHVRLDAVDGGADFEKDGLPRVFDDHPDALTYVHLQGDTKTPDKSRQIMPGVPSLFTGTGYRPKSITLPAFAYAPGTRTYVTRRALEKAESDVREAKERLAKSEQALAQFILGGPKATTFLEDDFNAMREDLWDSPGNDWKFEDGKLIRHTPNRSRNLRGKITHPRDMEIVFRYRTTGGTTYKSIGVRFDLSKDEKNYNQVYTSAHAPQPKLQISYQLDGRTSYPSARVFRKIEIGHLYEMRILVRNRLINVFLDGEFILAYELPRRHENGVFELSSFDATSEFDAFTVRELPDFVTLAKPGAKTGPDVPKTREELNTAIEFAQMDVERFERKQRAIKARIAADSARVTSASDRIAAFEEAYRLEAEAEQFENRYLLQKSGGKADPKKVAGYKKAIADAKKRISAGGTNYTSLAGSLKALETPEHKFGDYAEFYSSKSTGRRLALANWITDKRNPLTARVAVNHIWMRHFGTPLVESVFDFGFRAKQPVHRDLLDWLAAELINSDWSMKHIHKLIVMSDAWRRSSSTLGADERTRTTDSANNYYWRMNPRRMESQLVRDNLLHLSGSLDRTIGGMAIAVNTKSTRRSIYFRHSRDDMQKFLSMFDDADFLQCYRRSESVVPQQALALSNSADALTAAEQVAERLETKDEFIKSAFELVLSREPDHYEIAECESFLRELGQVDVDKKRVRLVHALLNHNDFVVIR